MNEQHVVPPKGRISGDARLTLLALTHIRVHRFGDGAPGCIRSVVWRHVAVKVYFCTRQYSLSPYTITQLPTGADSGLSA
jgi:hypothetical protein